MTRRRKIPMLDLVLNDAQWVYYCARCDLFWADLECPECGRTPLPEVFPESNVIIDRFTPKRWPPYDGPRPRRLGRDPE